MRPLQNAADVELHDASSKDHSAPLDLRAAVGQAVDALTPRIRAHGHELTVCLGSDPVWVAGDERRLVQVFSSLLHNAVTHTAPAGKLSVFVHVSGGTASVHISDNGCGIPRNALHRVFARNGVDHEDGHRAADNFSLADLRQLVLAHDGDIIAHSDGQGCGSRFVVQLPAASNYDRSNRRA